jgi:hypothetical protein
MKRRVQALLNSVACALLEFGKLHFFEGVFTLVTKRSLLPVGLRRPQANGQIFAPVCTEAQQNSHQKFLDKTRTFVVGVEDEREGTEKNSSVLQQKQPVYPSNPVCPPT